MFDEAIIKHEGVWYEVFLTSRDRHPILSTMDFDVAKLMVMRLRGYDG